MSKNVFGDVDATTLQLYAGYPETVLVGTNRYEITYKYWCAQNVVGTLIPAYRTACPLDWASNHKLLEASVRPNGKPGLVDLTLVYKFPGFTASRHAAGEIIRTATVSWVEVPIDDPRLIPDFIADAAAVQAKKDRGERTQPIGSIEYTYTTYENTGTWTETALTSGIGETSAPTGMTGATAAKWIKAGVAQRDDGDLTEKSITWRFHALGW